MNPLEVIQKYYDPGSKVKEMIAAYGRDKLATFDEWVILFNVS